MKKLLLLALCLALTCSVALAEIQIVKTNQTDGYVVLTEETQRYCDNDKTGYYLFDANGQVISAAYQSMSANYTGMWFEVRNQNGLNTQGLLDHNGKQVTELAYGDIQVIDGNWALCYVLAPTSDAVGEYKDDAGNRYNIDRTDVVYRDRVIGSLGREDFTKASYYVARGKYLFIKKTDHDGFWLDGNFNRVDVHAEDYLSNSEFTDVYRKGVFHNPTQQWAFTAGCTLTAEDVYQSIWYDDDTGNLLDLQGNVIKANLPYDSVRYVGPDYMLTRRGGKYGIMTTAGEEVVPVRYKEMAYNEGLFLSGYQAVLDDEGRLHYLDRQGNVTAKVDYKLSSSNYRGYYNNPAIVAVENMGQYIIITATQGELTEKYDSVITPGPGHRIIAVQKDNAWGVIDMDGNTVIPFELRSSPVISDDGALVYGQNQKKEYTIYHLAYTDGAAQATEVPTTEAPVTPAPAEDGWTCPCGATNSGKFCTTCGFAKPTPTLAPTATPVPADDGVWTCACGNVNDRDFCLACGTAKPPEKVVCLGCGYDPGENTPKFCPECGTKF